MGSVVVQGAEGSSMVDGGRRRLRQLPDTLAACGDARMVVDVFFDVPLAGGPLRVNRTGGWPGRCGFQGCSCFLVTKTFDSLALNPSNTRCWCWVIQGHCV